ncbi:hypothetical protein SK128_020006 [Halocaridina rubra]|uniref:Uncharacterized protein n=1 Tax=Halocaridina rubra TaxID=373956 RepID=A0AAN8WSC2_HALRR
MVWITTIVNSTKLPASVRPKDQLISKELDAFRKATAWVFDQQLTNCTATLLHIDNGVLGSNNFTRELFGILVEESCRRYLPLQIHSVNYQELRNLEENVSWRTTCCDAYIILTQDCVNRTLKNRGTSVQQVEEERLYEDRSEWRSFIHGQPTDG